VKGRKFDALCHHPYGCGILMQPAEAKPAATTRDPRIPPVEACVLRDMLEKRAAEQPDDVYVVFGTGEAWSYAETLRQTRRAAAGLESLGVRQDDKVLLALPNGPDALRYWFGANYIGATAVPVNLAYKGGLLERVVTNSEAKALVSTAQFAGRLTEINRGCLQAVAVNDDVLPDVGGLIVRAMSDLDKVGEAPGPLARPILPFDLQCIIYTSGTTGPSKGVMCSYLHLNTAGRALHFMTAEDRYMVNLPMYHVSGILPCMMMMTLGGSVAIVERFRTEEFWSTIETTGTTFVILLGVMMRYVLSQPVREGERSTTLRKIIAQPYDGDALLLRERFGFDVYATFNMTEISIPLVSDANPASLGACGRVRSGVEVRIVDEWDCEVPVGEVGELIIRTDQPWAMNHGYYKEPEATAKAWRNGWFHTGDGFRRDEAGNYYFVDRLKDTIRRRGENISSFEVEAEIIAHPAVREVAAVAVPSEVSESEVLVAISLVEGAALDPVELIDFLRPRLPYFMIPRYIRIMGDLPKTPTQKIEKHVLRASGVVPDVWDREEAGIRVGRDTVASRR
jgi:crotonobetaine/carnitine-CoA ligase